MTSTADAPRLLYQDEARIEYGRLLWKNPASRERLLAHWTDSRHPYHERFEAARADVEWALSSGPDDNAFLEAALRERGSSLRALVREIPPVFGSFY